MYHKKFGPDRFSRFDVYWIQTDKQTDRQTDKPNLYIDLHHPYKESKKGILLYPWVDVFGEKLVLGAVVKKNSRKSIFKQFDHLLFSIESEVNNIQTILGNICSTGGRSI